MVGKRDFPSNIDSRCAITLVGPSPGYQGTVSTDTIVLPVSLLLGIEISINPLLIACKASYHIGFDKMSIPNNHSLAV